MKQVHQQVDSSMVDKLAHILITKVSQSKRRINTSWHAAVGGVTKCMHMEPMEARLEARDTSGDSGGA